MGKDRKTLYISLSEFGGIGKKNPEEKECLTEALYHFKENNLSPIILRAISYERDSYSAILPVRSPEDISSLSPRELSFFLNKIAEDSGAACLIIDTDSSMSLYTECFPEMKKVFMPVLDDKKSKEKLDFFQNYLHKNLPPEALDKFVQCHLPGTSLKEYAESLVIHYIYEEEYREKEQYKKMVL